MLELLNQIFETNYQSLDEISDHELLKMLVSLKCAELGATVFICGSRPTLYENRLHPLFDEDDDTAGLGDYFGDEEYVAGGEIEL